MTGQRGVHGVSELTVKLFRVLHEGYARVEPSSDDGSNNLCRSGDTLSAGLKIVVLTLLFSALQFSVDSTALRPAPDL
jgi:hypothetical protein